jgi:creatinine amidohydrolase
MTRPAIVLILLLTWASAACTQPQTPPVSAASKIYRLDELRWPQVEALDRERTLWILPVGMLEVHGPHLPIGTDSLGLSYEVDHVSKGVSAALPDWSIVVMPPVSYGAAGANELGGRLVHSGTYGIRQATLRSVVADLGGQVAQNGFKWIFVLNGHASPTHNIAINDAADFVNETFRPATMLHVTALLRADPEIQARGRAVNARFFSADELASFGLDLHAGVSETSGMLAVRPDLVDSSYRTLPRQVGQSLDDVRDVAGAAGWQGYLSDPARASAAHGHAIESWWIEGFTNLIVRAVSGESMAGRPRFPDAIPPPVAAVTTRALANEAAFEATLQRFLSKRQPAAAK